MRALLLALLLGSALTASEPVVLPDLGERFERGVQVPPGSPNALQQDTSSTSRGSSRSHHSRK